MNDQDIRSYEMLLRVGDYGVEEASFFPATTLGGELFSKISAAVIDLGKHIAKQVSGSTSAQQGTSSKAAARSALRKALERIRRTARSMSATMPGIDTKFRIPGKATDQELLAVAQACATDATPLKNEFIRFAMPPDFLDDLNELIEDFRRALSVQQTGKVHQVSATAAIEDTLDEALSAERQLDAIVRNTFHDDPARLAAWLSASHVERTPRKKKTKPTPPAIEKP